MNHTWPVPSSSRAWPAPALPWRVAFELDLTRLPAQSLSGSNASFGGLTWTLGNASSTSTFDISPGAGLRIAPSDNTELTGSVASAPWASVPVADLLPQRTRSDRVLVQVRVSQPGLVGGSQSFGLLCGAGAVAANRISTGALVLHDGSLKSHAANFHNSGLWSYAAAIGAEPHQLAVEWWPVMGRAFYGTATRWERPGELTPMASPGNVEPLDPSASEGAIEADSDLLRLAAWRPSGASAFTATFSAIRVLWSPR